MSTRDPRVYPRAGDVVAVGTDVREVIGCHREAVEYGFPRRSAVRRMLLVGWRTWAAQGVVVEAAA